MGAFDHFGDMYDVALKPRLLNTLVTDYLPDNKKPFKNLTIVSEIISLIKTHRLLSESFTDSTDPKQVEAWKSAVTTWVDRVLSLLDGDATDKCWAGVALLGVTCDECSSDRFQKSYYVWFHKLLPFVQTPEDSFLVRMAACISISDLLKRLSGFPKLKKDGSSCAIQVVQPVLNLFSDCNSEPIWEAAIHVLCNVITSFPFTINRNYDSVESAIASKLMSGGCSHDMSKKLAHCLALLPKSRADEESWSIMLKKFLVVINDQLNFAFQGLEEENIRNRVTRMLALQGESSPSPLGGYILAKESSNQATRRSVKSLMSNASTLMHGCCVMLKNSYPYTVNVPVHMLLSLIERILMVNGSLPQMSLPFMTAKQQEDICSALPLLHLSSLDLLAAIIKVAGSQLLPHSASVVRIISRYFKTCGLPELRIKFYQVTKTLILSMGVAMVAYLAQDVVNNAFADLQYIENMSGGTLNGSNPLHYTENMSGGPLNGSNPNATTASLVAPHHRKRKSRNTSDSLQEHDDDGVLGGEVPKSSRLTPISLRIAALEALETLITVAGSFNSKQWRSQVDNLLIVIATDSLIEGSACEEEISLFQQREFDATTTDLQLAALRALLASLLSCARVRPRFLSEGIDLFRRGKREIGTKVAEFCTHALLTLEVLIHPRTLPLANSSSFGEAQHNFRDEHVDRSNRNLFGLPQARQDTIDTNEIASWMKNANEIVDLLNKDTQESSEASKDNNGTKVQGSNEIAVSEAYASADVEMRVVNDETALKPDQPVEPAVQSREPAVASERVVSDSATAHNEGSIHMESGQGSSANKGFESASQSTSLLQRTSDSTMIQETAYKSGGSNSLADEDDFPDIVDQEPDSDSD